VLLVDDEPLVVEALQRLLYDAPFEVDTATSGADALRSLERGGVDVIVCDEQMPGLRGAELLACVRERYPRIMRVMLTGDGSLESAVRAINVGGVYRFLQKPCDAGELRRCIIDALGVVPEAAANDHLAHEVFDAALAGLWLAAQPIVDLRQQRVHAYELLVRSTSRELPNPGVLFETAERLDAVAVLEGRILSLAADVVSRAPPDVDIFVNLHPATLGTPALMLPLHGVASRVVLEITERAALPETGPTQHQIAELCALGFRIAIDDLGAGYAGLTHVARLHPDVVKLDLSLVQGVTESHTHARLVAAMIGVCRELGIAVIGEGVETAGTRDKLLELGCSLQQGYLFARPGRPFPAVGW
jgi:EAL domain-containing protein (putative c-di-GMP-specific phosphodiesterase class I)